jgi:hypothetical protein
MYVYLPLIHFLNLPGVESLLSLSGHQFPERKSKKSACLSMLTLTDISQPVTGSGKKIMATKL